MSSNNIASIMFRHIYYVFFVENKKIIRTFKVNKKVKKWEYLAG